mmetsp:Transcript_53928/g.60294  ORF Transcript_53928/g.60294 Transcript_53928/m.60294 type:complete len:259 (+) Transcript_53928:544-1320(+)
MVPGRGCDDETIGVSFETLIIEISFLTGGVATEIIPDPLVDASSICRATSKIERQWSGPPQAWMTSITSTIPRTDPPASHSGKVKNLLSCIIFNASIASISGSANSGSVVITVDTAVDVGSSSAATTRVIMSLNPKIPTSFPSSTTSAAFLLSVIALATSRTLVSGETIAQGVSRVILRNEGIVESPPNALLRSGYSRASREAVSAPPVDAIAFFINCSAALGLADTDRSNLDIASLRHFAISNVPTTSLPVKSTTGK